MFGFGQLFLSALLAAAQQGCRGQHHQQPAQNNGRQPESCQIERPVLGPILHGKAVYGAGIAHVGRGHGAGHLVQLNGIGSLVQRLGVQRNTSAVRAGKGLFNFYMPAPDILALNAVTGQVLRTAHGLVKPNGHGIAAMQRHAFHRRFGQAVAHIHGSVGFHCAAQLRHAQGQHIQALAVKIFIHRGFDLQRIGKGLLFFSQGIGQFAFMHHIQLIAAQGLAQLGKGVVIIHRHKDIQRHVQAAGGIFGHSAQQSCAGGGIARFRQGKDHLARRNALVIFVDIVINYCGCLHQVGLVLFLAFQRVHGVHCRPGINGRGQNAGCIPGQGIQHNLVLCAFGADQPPQRNAVFFQRGFVHTVVHRQYIADRLVRHADVAGGDLFIPQVQLHPCRPHKVRADGLALCIRCLNKHVQLRHVDIDLLNGKFPDRGA